MTFYTFFVIELATRRVDIIGTTPSPDGIFMAEVAKVMTDPVDGIMAENRFLIRDNDAKFSHGFDGILEDEGVETIRIPYGAPNANAFSERFVKTLKDECLSRMIFFGAESLMRAQRSFLEHYHLERNHRGIGNRLINDDVATDEAGNIKVRERLGGMLRYYHRAA